MKIPQNPVVALISGVLLWLMPQTQVAQHSTQQNRQEQSGTNDVRQRLQKMIEKSDVRGAVKELDAILIKDSSNVEALFLRAEMQLKLYNAPAALNDYDRITRIEPANRDAYISRVMIKWEQQRNYAGAAEEMTNLLRLDSTNGLYWFYRGSLHEELKNFVAASADYDRALRFTDPDNATILLRRAVCLAQQGRTEEAAKEFTALIKLRPSAEPFFIGAGFY